MKQHTLSNSIVFITWTKYTKRASYLSEYAMDCLNLNIQSNLKISKVKFFKPFFYILYFLQTLLKLISLKPKLVIAQSGPIFCPLAVYLFAIFTKCDFIVDTHTRTWTGFTNKLWLQRVIFNRAIMIFVHNYETLNLIRNYKNIKVLYDYPKISNQEKIIKDVDRLKFLFVPSHIDDNFAIISTLCDVFENFPNVELYVTGNIHFKNVSSNISFVGFLNDSDYRDLLEKCNISIILLNRKDKNYVQSCRAVEAISYEMPVIHTDSNAVREIFSQGGALYIRDNNVDEIRDAVIAVVQQYNAFRAQVIDSKLALSEVWQNQFKEIESIIKKYKS